MKLLNEILGTKYPIIQGGMANIATGEFAAACSNAGALGIIGAGGMNADTLRQNIRRCRELTDKPFGVNIMLMHPQADEFAQIVVEEKVAVVTTGAGNPGKYVSMWKAADIKVIPVVAAAVLARHLEPLGIDAVIAEGTESGGHVGEMTTMALVPQVVDAVSVPVIAEAALPMAVSWRLRWRWAPAVCRWAPACWQARSAPFTPTTRPRCSKPGTVTPSSPGAPWVRRCVC